MRLLALAFALVLSGCATTVGKQYPPSALLEDCRTGALTFTTDKDMAESVVALAAALKLCNIDKAALREWAKD